MHMEVIASQKSRVLTNSLGVNVAAALRRVLRLFDVCCICLALYSFLRKLYHFSYQTITINRFLL